MKKLIRFICFLLVTSTVLCGLNLFLSTNNDRDGIHIKGYFKEPKNTIDVLLIGASELYTGFNSPLAWEKYGFTSYSLSYASMPGSMYKPVLNKALKTQSPKLVAVEVNGFMFNDKYCTQRRPIHAWFDSVGIDSDGKSFIEENIPKENRAEFYLPFYKYHSNWRHPVVCARNFVNLAYLEKEGISYSKTFANTALKREKAELTKRKSCFTEKSKEYMTDLLKTCREKGLKNVLFFRAPHCVKNQNPQAIKDMEKLICEYGYRFVDYENAYEEIGLDVKNDFYNIEHLNIFGMEKFTLFFGKYICENYDVKSEHSEKTVKQWNKCADVMSRTVEECKNDKECNIFYELTAYEVADGRPHSALSKVENGRSVKQRMKKQQEEMHRKNQ